LGARKSPSSVTFTTPPTASSAAGPGATAPPANATTTWPDAPSYFGGRTLSRYDSTGISDDNDPALTHHYDYNGLDQLTQHQPHTGTLSTQSEYRYDLSGNRTHTLTNNRTDTHTIDPGSNRLLQTSSGNSSSTHTYDLTGNLLTDGTFTYQYNAQGRRTFASSATLNARYRYNGLGQRASKTVNGLTTHYHYDRQGKLIGETSATGQLRQEIIWLEHLPIAVLTPKANKPSQIDINYLHADHLGTPRQITRPSDNKVLWTWESEPFGNTPPNDNPSGLGPFTFNLRFPGQYYDKETGLFYNYFRDYDPKTGRYIESDPIGLAGGINGYGYVGGNPVNSY
jgi:RHS repeat-associated protein